MADAIRNVEQALGEIRYGSGKSEESSKVFRRSLFVVENMRKGEVFTGDNVRIIRPGYGLHPRFLENVLGCRVTRDVARGLPWPGSWSGTIAPRESGYQRQCLFPPEYTGLKI